MLNYIYFFIEFFTIVSALFVVLNNENPIHSIIYLILRVIGFSCMLILRGFDFLGMAFLVVYVGAVAVLFLFVVMMLNLKGGDYSGYIMSFLKSTYTRIAFCQMILVYLVIFFCEEFVYKFFTLYDKQNSFSFIVFEDWTFNAIREHNIYLIGNLLYTHHFYLVIGCALILLLAMIGAIALTLNNNAEQVS